MIDVVAWLNQLANWLGAICLSPIGWLPGWLSATIVGAVTGVLMLVVFKYTSHQTAIKQTRDQIKANLIALSLFKDDVRVGLRAQGRILANAGKLLMFSLVPMLVMMIPMVLVLGQLALWYQARPLRVGEEAVLAVDLSPAAENAVQNVTLNPKRCDRNSNWASSCANQTHGLLDDQAKARRPARDSRCD